MTDDRSDTRFDALMRDAARTYRTPPAPDFDAMWERIEQAHDAGSVRSIGDARSLQDSQKSHRATPVAGRRWMRPLAIAATLVVGIAIGRGSMSLGSDNRARVTAAKTVATTSGIGANAAPRREEQPYEAETSKYLGQTAALLIALPSEAQSGRRDDRFTQQAGDLLSRTRLLLDSPAASDPQMHNLLEDLELVLAQIVRLQHNSTDRTELDLIRRGLEQRDVITRLRTAVADIAAD